ncbi:DUF924 family protein [Nitrincola alkalisediminis]|uniref:DUF924 family protein n=1 Tax=Nitrincola alkalisediminis TaxID=1366656 RepID=UPI002483C4B5|nr:DUF924 family protein [Nitrincola alkalisediminis]
MWFRIAFLSFLWPPNRQLYCWSYLVSNRFVFVWVCISFFSIASLISNSKATLILLSNRFGYYPHRNDILGRRPPPEEIEFQNHPNSNV